MLTGNQRLIKTWFIGLEYNAVYLRWRYYLQKLLILLVSDYIWNLSEYKTKSVDFKHREF